MTDAPTFPLYMIQLQPDAIRAGLWMASEGLSQQGADDGYGWHALLKAAFGNLAPKPFRIIEHARKPLQLLAYSQADEAALRDQAAAFAAPVVVAALNLPSLAVKRMPNSFAAGQRFGFEVRIRPTIRQHPAGDRARSRERDAFLAAIEKVGPREARAEIDRVAVYTEWLRGHLEKHGARLIGAQPLALRRTRVSRRNGERHLVSNIEGPDCTFSGGLEVVQPNAFRGLLARGVGRHRTFGFGMLLLRPYTGSINGAFRSSRAR